jgi:hypothetical protein
MRLNAITITVASGAATGSKSTQVDSGRCVAAFFAVPTLDSGTAKVQIADATTATNIYINDTAIGSGTCAAGGTTPQRFASSGGAFYPIYSGPSGVTVLVTCNGGVQSADRTFTLYLLMEGC